MAGKDLDPKKPRPAWDDCVTCYDLVQDCRVMLALHGFLSSGESEKVAGRIRKWEAEAATAGGEE